MAIESVNPATGKRVHAYEPISDGDLLGAIAQAQDAFGQWRSQGVAHRAGCLRALADRLEEDREMLASLVTMEMGKPTKQARAEIDKCAWVCRHYAEHGPALLEDERIAVDEGRAFRRFLPLGPILAVMPWNFPFWQVFRFAAPNLLLGNVALLKHASNVPACALAIESLFERAGFPAGCFRTLLIESARVRHLIEDSRIRGVTLTGSGPAGARVAGTAGERLKKSVLELGGSDPFLVMPSARLDDAVATAVKSRTQNNGQSCIAAKRFIVHTDVYREFRDRFVAGMEALEVGDPTLQDTDVGPLFARQGRDDCERQVRDLLQANARRLTGAESVDGPGFYYRPGIVEAAVADAARFDEEIFGPVALLFEAADLDEAVRVANATPLGLGSTIFTEDTDEVERACQGIEAGSTFVNTMVASDPRLPFGGIKDSGHGRELAVEGLREFANVKTLRLT